MSNNVELPQLTRWCNTVLRPNSEYCLYGFIWAEEVVADYEQSIEPLLTSYDDADIIVDGRAHEGVSVLTIGDLRGYINVIKVLQSNVTDGARAVVRKPTVQEVFAR